MGAAPTGRLKTAFLLRLGEGGLGAKDHFFAQRLLPLDLWQQQFFPIVGTVRVARPQLCRQTVTFPIEQQQRVMRGLARS